MTKVEVESWVCLLYLMYYCRLRWHGSTKQTIKTSWRHWLCDFWCFNLFIFKFILHETESIFLCLLLLLGSCLTEPVYIRVQGICKWVTTTAAAALLCVSGKKFVKICEGGLCCLGGLWSHWWAIKSSCSDCWERQRSEYCLSWLGRWM